MFCAGGLYSLLVNYSRLAAGTVICLLLQPLIRQFVKVVCRCNRPIAYNICAVVNISVTYGFYWIYRRRLFQFLPIVGLLFFRHFHDIVLRLFPFLAMQIFVSFTCILSFIFNHVSCPANVDFSPGNPNPLRIPTASDQFSLLNNIPVHYFLKAHRLSIPLNVHFSSIVTLLVILSGDIHLNPGPSSSNINLGTLNIRSLFHENRSVAIPDLIKSHDIHILALPKPGKTNPQHLHNSATSHLPVSNSLVNPGYPQLIIQFAAPVTTHLAVVSDSSSGITLKPSYTHCPHTNLSNLSPSP